MLKTLFLDFAQNKNLLKGFEVNERGEHHLLLTRWNTSYQEIQNLQHLAQAFVYAHPEKKIFIFTSHRPCFTLGRGLQKGKDPKLQNLKPWDESLSWQLPYPLIKTKRGGGLTFHYPGQWVFYPILRLNQSWTLSQHLRWPLDLAQKVLYDHYHLATESEKTFTGLWWGEKKIASLGIALKRFVTYHGFALNLQDDASFFAALKTLHPCGLEGKIYSCVEKICEYCITPQEFHRHALRALHASLPQ